MGLIAHVKNALFVVTQLATGKSRPRRDVVRTQLPNGAYSLTAGEVRRLIRAQVNIRDRALVRLLAETGLRRSEAAGLESGDIDFEHKVIVVREGKGRKMRIVPMTLELAKELSQLKGPNANGYLFTSRQARGLSQRQINRIMAQAGKRAGIRSPNPRHQQITCHLLRHTFARLWKTSGGGIESLSAILGHASVKTTWDTYGRESLGDIQHNYNETVARMFPQSANKRKYKAQ